MYSGISSLVCHRLICDLGLLHFLVILTRFTFDVLLLYILLHFSGITISLSKNIVKKKTFYLMQYSTGLIYPALGYLAAYYKLNVLIQSQVTVKK